MRKAITVFAGVTAIVSILAIVLMPPGCTREAPRVQLSYYDEIRSLGELRVLTRNAPTTLYEGRDGPAGLEYDLVNAFSRFLGVRPVFIVKSSVSEILSGLENREGTIAAAGLSKTEKRAQAFQFGPTYHSVHEQVVCRRGSNAPKSVKELADTDLWIAADTSYSDTLVALRQKYPDITWHETTDYDTEQLLQRVWYGEIGCTIADSNIVAINRRYLPELVVALTLGDPQELAWLLPGDSVVLKDKLGQWLTDFEQSGELDSAIERNYGFVKLFDYVDLRIFKKRIKTRLPKYKNLFVEAATEYRIPWTLLAAQSYQESHWRRRARSPTGVRGIMMLTLVTARELGIKSRLNARDSIFGGAQYLASLEKRMPEGVREPDRTWFALAAYNVGIGHIYDARALAEQHGMNPDLWISIEAMLPLLSQKEYFKKLKYGYARGSEPVNYVRQIRDYQDILEKELGVH